MTKKVLIVGLTMVAVHEIQRALDGKIEVITPKEVFQAESQSQFDHLAKTGAAYPAKAQAAVDSTGDDDDDDDDDDENGGGDGTDFSKMNKKQLQEALNAKQVAFDNNADKATLVALLTAAVAAESSLV